MSKPEESKTENVESLTAGQRLQQAREVLALSVDEVAERMHIDTSKVMALESGAVSDVGAPVFAAGYIRAYARIVGLSADELIAEFESLRHLNAADAEIVSGYVPNKIGRLDNELPASFLLANGRRWRSVVRWASIILLLLVIAASAFWLLKSGMWASSQPTANPAEEMPLPDHVSSNDETDNHQMLAIPGQTGLLAAVDDSETVSDASISLPLSIQSGESSSLPAPAMEADAQAAMKAADSDQLDELKLQFQEDSWVEIHDARRQRLIHQLAHAGQTQTLYGVAPFSLVLGYVPGVTVTLNGEAVDLSGYQGRRLARLSIGEAIGNAN